MLIIPVTDPDDERIELYRHVKDRDLTGRAGLFMAEGQVVLERLFTSPLCETISVLTTEARLKALKFPTDFKAPVYVLAQSLMDEVAGFPIHRGYLALGRYRPPQSLGEVLNRPQSRLLVLSQIANVDNMGAMFRNAAAFGIEAILLDKECCDPLYRKAIRVSVGGVFTLPHYRCDDILKTLAQHKLTAYALSPRGAHELKTLRPEPRSAFIFGAEGPGLKDDILNGCESVKIPMSGGFDSLNVATTAAIVLYQVMSSN